MQRILPATPLIASTTLLLAMTALSPAADDWPAWRGTDGTGVSTESSWTVEGKDESLWTAKVGLGYSSFAVKDGRAITAGFNEAAEQDSIYCFDATTGKEIWKHSFTCKKWDKYHTGGTLSTPVIDGDHVYALNREGKVFCLDFADGSVVWQKNLMDGYDLEYPEWMFSASPYILGDNVLFNVGPVIALNKSSGEEAWKTRDSGDAYSTPQIHTIDGRDYLVVFNGNGLYLFNPGNGAQVANFPWKTQYDVNASTPVFVGEKIFISSGYNHGCAMLELIDGELKPLWESKDMRTQMTGCVLYDGHLYGFDDAILKCLGTDGSEKWSHRGLGKGAMMIADGKMIIASGKGELVIADATPAEFKEISRDRVLEGGVYWTTPILANGLIYVRNSMGDVVCRDHRNAES